ncbi:MAG: histidine ammonia-lyase [Flavobacteriales bacterium]
MDNHHYINPSERLTLQAIQQIISQQKKIALSDEAIKRIEKCRHFLDHHLPQAKAPVYGINTGFGSLCNTVIADSELEQLQKNLLLSHACGIGEEVPPAIVKMMLLLKAQGLSYGHSGVQLSTVQRLIEFYNHNMLPVVYQQGSLGASGDLAPLAHLALPLIGEGEVCYKGVKMKSVDALQKAGMQPIMLKSKEGLALINGTQFMSAYATHILIEAENLMNKSTSIAAMSIDAFDARPEPFDDLIHTVRPHGQRKIAAQLRSALSGSEIQMQKKEHVQDPYSFRCIPQVHGASADAINYVSGVVETEINSVTDNPIIFPDEEKIISGGNFHGQPLALALDFLCLALAELGSISERRTYKLISGQRGLPPYLAGEAGLNSGFMIPQYTSASIVSQNKQLCTPASIDSIDSSNGQEDHVSMGANAATKCLRVLENVRSIFSIELLNAAQALDFRRPLKSSSQVESMHQQVRKLVGFSSKDEYLHAAIMKCRALLE